MKKKRSSGPSAPRVVANRTNGRRTWLVWLVGAGLAAAAAVVLGATWWMHERDHSPRPEAPYAPKPKGTLSFNKHIAPILFEHCAGCHRPGESGPFPLLTYDDVRKRARTIAEVTARRYMPPWLPERGLVEFADERRLSAEQIGLIQQWASEGAVEGAAGDLPAPPRWTSDWELGPPDLVLSLPQPYVLPAEGRDVYRNFVLPAPVSAPRYVRALEFRPGNRKVAHHVFIKVDRTGQSRRLDAKDAEPGFPGMNPPARMPDGHLIGWQPGRRPFVAPAGLAWGLAPGSDFVCEMHMNPSGKPEPVQPSLGLYFTDQKPTNTCFKLWLSSLVLAIPAGTTNYVVEDSYQLPVDVQVLAVLPHAHYLARDMQGWAVLPDGTRQWLLHIKQWDFNWQGDYRYARPIALPRGSTLSMRFTYDNSTNNVRNPHQPPKEILYGPQSSDEMAELWFQILPRNGSDLALLEQDFEAKLTRQFDEHSEFLLRRNPNDYVAHTDLGAGLISQGRMAEAEQHFRAALAAKPDYTLAHYRLGVLLRRLDRLDEARAAFEAVLRLDPEDAKAHGNLGAIALAQHDPVRALEHFNNALRFNPDDTLAREGLQQAMRGLGQ